MPHCYCANFYGAVNCQNKVTKFGERCRLCTVMNEGSSTTYELFGLPSLEEEYYHHHHDLSGRDDSSQSSREDNQHEHDPHHHHQHHRRARPGDRKGLTGVKKDMRRKS
ncbi:hypothetical protein F4778DRAFT_572973 [Xylariomycetidae sp. FL2044]|nr:hypothetical protein F4778DRAFT_572973 [Xylariomycetidae sp. FL2044]